jgi:hypothetical protein
MKKFGCSLLAVSFLSAFGGIVSAQEKSYPPPKVLLIMREYTKPGKAGSVHDKAESAFVQAFARAKWPTTHYFGMTSLSGKSRALFFTPYDSFEAWEKDAQATEKNAALSAALDRATAADGELLDSSDQGIFVYREDFSLRAPVDIPHMRYIEIGVFRVKQGRDKEWEEGLKMVLAASEKSDPQAHWACYENVYGAPAGTFLFITPLKSASEIDHNLQQGKAFAAAMGEDGMKKLGELSAASIESSETNVFAFNPRMSYVPDEWITADPGFWKPKPAGAPAAKPAAEDKKEKPAQ